MRSCLQMFRSSSQYLCQLTCPKREHCKLPHCVFGHNTLTKRAYATENEPIAKKAKITEPDLQPSQPVQHIEQHVEQGTEEEKDLNIWIPKDLPGVGAPATVQQRIRYISSLITYYKAHKVPLPKKTAVNAEFEIAKSSKSSTTYSSNMKHFLNNARKNIKSYLDHSTAGKVKQLTKSQIFDEVHALIHQQYVLERQCYVMQVPTDYHLPVTNRDNKSCERCSNIFNINEITEKTKCVYHERKKIVQKSGGGEIIKVWDCCEQAVGESQGCKESEHHVFKLKDAYELHLAIPFRSTPKAAKDAPLKKQIYGVDCEMAYTSKGMECIRLTMVDFYTGETVFDEIMKPSGIVIDLNTRWSGVSEIPATAMTLEQVHEVILGTYITEDTILVGHGFENDLLVLRLIHPNVVDTSILFPKGLSSKYALKDLAFQFLDRKIQSGEHSSEEDSLAAIDIIKKHIKAI